MTKTPPLLSVNEQLVSRLRAGVFGGQFRPGDALREETLAGQYGVTRASVRQAFGQLVQEGLLVAKRNCGVRVAPPPDDTVRELLMPMRVMLEAYALKACLADFARQPDPEWDRLLGNLKAACVAGDYAAAVERDFDFHRHLVVRGGLTDLLPLWTSLLTKTNLFYKHEQLTPDDLPAVHEMHAELLALFRAGAEGPAVEALTQHIMNGDFNERVRRRWRAAKAGGSAG